MVYFLPFIAPTDGEGGMGLLLNFNLFLNLIPCILSSLALFVVAWGWGIRRPWLALIPVADLWVLGKITDTYNLHTRGSRKNASVMLPALGLASLLSSWLPFALGALIPPSMVLPDIVLILLAMVTWGAFLLCRYVALCDLYRAGTSGKENWYMVLSVCFPFLIPYFIFSSR